MNFRIFYLILICFLLSGCSSKEDPLLIAKRTLSIGCSNDVLANIVSVIAGDRATVFVFGNSKIHDELDLKGADTSDFLVVLGEGCEPEFKSIKKSYKTKLIAVLDTVDNKLIRNDAIQAGLKDCHFWFDDRLILPISEEIENRLVSLDPQSKDYYSANRASFDSDVVASFLKFKTLLNHVPKSQRVLVTTHEGFSYFGDKFSFETYGLWVSDEKSVTDRDISRLADFIIRRWVRYVFVEYPVGDIFIEKLNTSINEKGWQVDIYPIFIHDLQRGTSANISLLEALEGNVRQFRKLLGSELDVMTIDDYLSSFD